MTVRRSILSLSLLLAGFALSSAFLVLAAPARAADTSDVQSQIDAVNAQKASLDAEIATYQKQLDALGTQHQTLQTSISTLTTSQNQLKAKIAKLRRELIATPSGGGGGGGGVGFDVARTGVASVGFVGFPSVGKVCSEFRCF